MDSVTVAFIYRAGCEWREKSKAVVEQRYREILPDAKFVIADSGHEVFNRAASRNKAVKLAESGIVVIADTDILPNPDSLKSAIEGAKNGGMHLGYDYYRALIKEATERYYLRKCDADRLQKSHDSRESTCGIVVIRCDEWWRAGGMDERFNGWGWEDTAFACAVKTMLGDHTYHKGTVNHLWHPSAVRVHSDQYQANKALCERYMRANGDIGAMMELINESSSYRS